MLLNKDEVADISLNSGVDVEKVDRILVHFWSSIKDGMRDDNIPLMRIMRLGVFSPCPKMLRVAILACIAKLRINRDDEDIKSDLRRFWKARNELIKIKYSYGKKSKGKFKEHS